MTSKKSLFDTLLDYEEASRILSNYSLTLQDRWVNALPLLRYPYPGMEPEELYEALMRLQSKLTRASPLTEALISSLVSDVDAIVVRLKAETMAIKQQITDIQHQIVTLQMALGIEIHRLSNAVLLRIDRRMTAYEFQFIYEFSSTFFRTASEDELRLFDDVRKLQERAFGKI